MKHTEGVELAARWLRKKGHAVVVTEMASQTCEPDAIGFKASGQTTLIEVKISRSDFLADKKKAWHRCPDLAMGGNRYYLAPPDMISTDELPEGWGLLEPGVRAGRPIVRVRQPAADIDIDHDLWAERRFLISVIRRIGAAAPVGISVRAYTIDCKGRATLGILPEHGAVK